jgi:hypothetical protein
MAIDMPNEAWYLSAPPCSATVPCASGQHELRWTAGAIELPAHPDGEAELVLAALGGEKAGCVELAEIWQRHVSDLSVLAIGPRGTADKITVTWDSVTEPEQHVPPAAMTRGRPPLRDHFEQARLRMTDVLSLLALGPEFGCRLAGHVVAAYAERLTPKNRPALTAALEGRLAPLAERWLGIEPGQVRAALHDGDGWGSVELHGNGADRELRVALPAGWLASVWACGLALVDRQLVVAVTEPGWPDARVLALPAPGRDPVELALHGSASADGGAHWEV